MSTWKRPENVPFPSVWRSFERQNADGSLKKYWVQDLTPEYEEVFLQKMVTTLLKDEPLCKYSNITSDPQAVEEFKQFWIDAIKRKLGIICLTKEQNGEIKFVGGNMTCIWENGQKFELKCKNKIVKKIVQVFEYVAKAKNVFTELNVNTYLSALGLYVLPEFRGQRIGTEILKARRDLCLAVGIEASATVFTSIISQKNARQAGFENLFEISYDELEKINPEWQFPGITSFTKTAINMAIKYV